MRIALGPTGALLLAVLCWCGLAPTARALEVPPLRGPVNDLASVLTPEQRSALEQKLLAHRDATSQEFALLTVPSLQGEPIEDYSIAVAEAWKLGSEKEDDGLVMVVALQDRKMRIEVGYGLEGAIPDALAARPVNRPRPLVSSGTPTNVENGTRSACRGSPALL